MFDCIKKWFVKKEEPKVEAPPQQAISETPIDLDVFKVKLTNGFSWFRPNQWDGFERISREYFKQKFTDLRQLAYILATAFHETAGTMQPITEYGSDAYLKAKSYWPFVGRGYVQLTWEGNYKKYGIDKTPEKALDPVFAAFIIVDGMYNGVFTGVGLPKYFNWTVDDPVNARRIVNGTDQATLIAGYHRQILTALLSSKPMSLHEHDLASSLNMGDLDNV